MSTNEKPSEFTAEERPDETSHTHENHEHYGEHHEHDEHHEHHHSHHHSHHSRRRRGRNKKKRSLKDSLPKFMKNKQFWINLSILLAALIALAVVGFMANRQQAQQYQQEQPQTQIPSDQRPALFNGTVSVSVPMFREEVCLVGEATLAVTKASGEAPIAEVLDDYYKSGQRMDEGLPVNLSYDISGLPTDVGVESALIEVSESQTFADSRVFELEDGRKAAAVRHLKTGTEYFYRITVRLTDGMEHSTTGSFRTMDTPRILSIDGAINVRDIGGWKTTDGRVIRQGLFYRGGELDGAIERDFSLTARGVEDMLTVLKIRTELDLRPHTDNKFKVDPLGATVNHVYMSLPQYEGVFTEEGMEDVRRIFSMLAEEETYPVYVHCTYGMDRTGTVCYLLEALLGMSEADMLREYRLSALYHGGVPQENLQPFLEGLDRFAGDTVQEKTENYLRSVGVTQVQIDSIKQIMLAQ